jgi:hypothetical protein
MREEAALYQFFSQYQKFIKKTQSKVVKDLSSNDSRESKKKLRPESIYNTLTMVNFDRAGFEYVQKSITHFEPSMSRKEFFKLARKEGFLKNITNEATQKRIKGRLNKELGKVFGRVDRLDQYLDYYSIDSMKASLSDIGRIIGTNDTALKNINAEIKSKEKVLRRKGINRAQSGELKKEIAHLKSQKAIYEKGQKALKGQLNRFAKNADRWSETRLKKEYDKLINAVKKDLIENQQKAVIEDVYKRSGGGWVNRVANDQFGKRATQKDLNELKERQRKGDKGSKLLVTWTLSVDHNIVDICDDYAEADVGFGAGIKHLDESPVPIEDSHIHCQCRLVASGWQHSDGTVERF